MRTNIKYVKTSVLSVALIAADPAIDARAQQTQSHLFEITKNRRLRVCTYPGYYAISFRNPKTQQLEGIDIDLADALAKSLGADLQFVETNFGTFIADVQTNKCDVAMFGIGITLRRAQAVEFTHAYLQTGIYAIVRKGGPIKNWEDIDKDGVAVAVTLGSYIEPFMQTYLRHASLVSIAPPATREQELVAHHVEAAIVDYPTAQRVERDFDWGQIIEPSTPLLGPEGPSARKRTVRNENTDDIPTISTWRRRFCSGIGINCQFVACNHGMQSDLHAVSATETEYCTH